MLFKISKISLAFSLAILVAGCWDSLEFNKTAVVSGVALDKGSEEGQLFAGLEVALAQKPNEEKTDSFPSSGGQKSQSIVLTNEVDSLLGLSRDFIPIVKRRLLFTHTQIWIFSERLARTDFVPLIAILHREFMVRPRSFLYISSGSPIPILEGSPIFKDTLSTELASATSEVKFNSKFIPVRVADFFERIGGPTKSAILPILTLGQEEEKQGIPKFSGTALFRGRKMVGKLDENETMGLFWLLDDYRGGNISLRDSRSKGTITAKLSKGKTRIKPELHNEHLQVDISVQVSAALSDYPSTVKLTDLRIKQLENEISEIIKSQIRHTLNELQNKYKTDVTNIGLSTYRRFPQQWHRIQGDWNSIFANAEIEISTTTRITDTGMIDNSFD